MTCPAAAKTLTSILLSFVSHEVVDRVCAPKIFAVQLDEGYGTCCEQTHNAPLSFLAWMQMWLRLVLGLEMATESSRGFVGTYAVPTISYRQIEPESLNKPAAHNLEALMRFAPDEVGQGLTLNQYRERFTRLSVLGRVQLYRILMCQMLRGRVLRVMGFGRPAFCQAPLRPD